MKARPPFPEGFRRRLVGLYALTLMEREGPVHGYGLSERIAQRTEGAWRPGPGSVYPSLRKLVESGLAKSRVAQRRREYVLTPRGRALLRRMRRAEGPLGRPRPDVSALWAEVVGSADVGRFLVSRLRRTIDSIESQLARNGDAAGPASLRSEVLGELRRASERLRAPAARSTPRRIVAVGGSRAG